MEVLINIVSYALLIGLVLIPVVILRLVHRSNATSKFTAYAAIGSLTMAVLTLLFAWWADTSNMRLLKHYGYNIDGMSQAENYEKVLPQHINKVESLEKSMMGIGWPLKAFTMFVSYSPYLLLVYVLDYLILKVRSKRAPTI